LIGPKAEHLDFPAAYDHKPSAPDKPKPASQRKAVSHDGTLVLQANDDNTATLLDRSGRVLLPPLVHGSSVVHVAFSPRDKRLLTASDDNSARIWDTATGQLLVPPLKHHGTVLYAAFSDDGRLVVTASRDETARVWDAVTGEPITPPLAHVAEVNQAAIAADGLSVTSVDLDGRAYSWKLWRDTRPVEQIVEEAQLLAGHCLDTTRGYLPLPPGQLQKLYGKQK
jgi:WD40 repeat protein